MFLGNHLCEEPMSKLVLGLAAAAVVFALSASAKNADPNVNKLPPGPERTIVANACTVCHTLERVVTASHDAHEWSILVDGMVNVGAPLTPEQIPQVKAYLAKIPAETEPKLKVLPGPAKVTIKEWDVPTPGSRPHDPLSMPDGSLWYTAHRSSILGRLDPATGKFTEYKTKTPISGPHGLAADQDGNIWYTGNFKGYIGKLDVKTGQFTEYRQRIPKPAIRTPRFSTNRVGFGSPCKAPIWSAGSIRRRVRSSWLLFRRREPSPTAPCSIRRACSGSTSS